MKIRRMVQSELQESLDLVWRVFLAFEAPEYSDQGIESFKAFIQPKSIQAIMNQGKLKVWVADEEGSLAGVIAVRENTHVSLLFVDPTFHRQGVATALFEEAFSSCDENITVNSSPYALEFYRRIGFVDQDAEQLVDGIRFIPMRAER